MSQNNNILTPEKEAALAALQWHIDNDLADMLDETPEDRTIPPDLSQIQDRIEHKKSDTPLITTNTPSSDSAQLSTVQTTIGAAQAIIDAKKIAADCHSLEQLKTAIQDFEGLSLKKMATNIVFGDGNPKADVMIIGEAPEAEEDAQGIPAMGESGQLLDKIMASIGLDRKAETPDQSLYITNVLNWRPPGNRSPTPQEIEISLPFIERHIALIAPRYLILCGGGVGKALLRQKDSLSKLRGRFYEYEVENINQPDELSTIHTIVTYHPTYLLRTPAQKRAVWNDMLMLKAEIDKNQ